MFPKSKYSKSNQSSSNYKSNLNISIKPVKYHPNIYSKKKTTLNKKMSFQSNNNKFTQNHTWKKHNSHNNWNKENNKNYLNYEQYNTNYESNQYYYIPKEKRENKTNYNKEKDQDKEKEYSSIYSYESNDYISNGTQTFKKNEKNNSIEYTTTQSNSSTHEESNNNQYNSNENENAYSTVTNENFVSNDSQTLNIEEEENTNTKQSSSNDINGIIDFKSFNSNLETTQQTEIVSDEPNPNNQKEIVPIQVQTYQKKNKKQKKYKKNNTFSKELDINKSSSGNFENEFQLNEPYNKFNSANSDLNEPIIVPMVENTEILKVNVKISKDKYVVFKLRRFDDLFMTVKLFCEINSIEEKLIRAIITKALCTLNSIYQIYNTQLDSRNIKILQMLKTINSDTIM
jgi:hypothetical protein